MFVMLGMVKNILEIGKVLVQLATGASTFAREKRSRLATLLDQVSTTLKEASSTLQRGETPHGACGALLQYSEELTQSLDGIVPTEQAKALGDTLRSSYAVERLAIELESSPEKSANLAGLEEAAGKFKAAADLLRAA